MKKILSAILLLSSFHLAAQEEITYSELGEKLGGSSDCTQMQKLLETDFGAKYGHNNAKLAKRAFATWLGRVERYIENNWCSPEDYIKLNLQYSADEKRFVTCLEIHQLTFVLDKNKPEEKKIIDEINEATMTWYCKSEDFKRLKAKVDVIKK